MLQRLHGPRTEGNAETHVTDNLCSKVQGWEPAGTMAAKQRQGSHPRTALLELSPASGHTALQRPDLQASLRQLRAPQSTRAASGGRGSPRGSDVGSPQGSNVVRPGLCTPPSQTRLHPSCRPASPALPEARGALLCSRPAQSQGRAERLWVGDHGGGTRSPPGRHRLGCRLEQEATRRQKVSSGPNGINGPANRSLPQHSLCKHNHPT